MSKFFIPSLNFIVLFLFFGFFEGCQSSPDDHLKLKIDPKEQPTIGNPQAPVHVIVFEEPKCSACKKFTTLIYPLIKKNYIDTAKVRYTIIPVSFIPKSMPAAIAWLCVYHQKSSDPELTFKYIDYMYSNQPTDASDWATEENLIQFAKETSPVIDLDLLKECLLKETYQAQIEKNTVDGTNLMQGELSAPGIYVNGQVLDTMSYEAIRQLIDQKLKEK